MALAIDATVGGSTANSYLAIADATAYFEAVLSFTATWTALTEAQKTARLVAATRAIDTFPFRVDPYSSTQALRFPVASQIGDLRYPLTIIPPPVVQATCEMVIYQYNTQGATDGQASREIDSVSIEGAVAVSFGRYQSSVVDASMGGNLGRIRALLSPWLGTEFSFGVTR